MELHEKVKLVEIPADLLEKLFPSSHGSVQELRAHKIPYQRPSAHETAAMAYLTENVPSSIDVDPTTLPMPPTSVIGEIVQALRHAPLGVIYRSIRCAHIPGKQDTYPLWIISYWAELRPIREARQRWDSATCSVPRFWIEWLWSAYSLINDPVLVKKSFALCKMCEWDLSYECLTSPRIRKRLRDEESQNTVFWQELQASRANGGLPSGTKKFAEDDEDHDGDEGPDDSDVSVAAVIADVVVNKRKGHVARKPEIEGGGLQSMGLAEDLEAGAEPALDDLEANGEPADTVENADREEGGRSKRTRKPNRRYLGWLHHDDKDGSDVEEGRV
ncbi:hypothetical protein C8R45DRAFT_1137955 [Mycena sanguinolenta]|nr:hypothetical protein C8R45DRAFT_1137955 [Mycena sanguinolenta]